MTSWVAVQVKREAGQATDMIQTTGCDYFQYLFLRKLPFLMYFDQVVT